MKMKITSNLFFIGVISLLIGSVFASPLLVSELDIVPFLLVPEGPKAEFSISVAYANFTINNNSSELEYYIVLNVTNHSDLTARVASTDFAAAQNVTIIPSAFGGFTGTHEGSGVGGTGGSNFVPEKGYAGHIEAGRVEGVWLDGEWINVTWVPEGGLDEIWFSEDILHPEGLDGAWPPPFYPYVKKEPTVNYTDNLEGISSFHSGGARSRAEYSYSYGGTYFRIGGGNYWIEGVPLKEHIVDNEVKTTIIYYNGSWIDVTGRVEVKESPYVTAANTLLKTHNFFGGEQAEESDSLPGGMASVCTATFGSGSALPRGFSNIWEPHQSRLLVMNGTIAVDVSGKAVEPLKNGEITLYSAATNHLKDEKVDGHYVYTYSSTTELKTVQLDITEDTYIYNTILSDDEMFVMDSFGIEVFIEPRS